MFKRLLIMTIIVCAVVSQAKAHYSDAKANALIKYVRSTEIGKQLGLANRLSDIKYFISVMSILQNSQLKKVNNDETFKKLMVTVRAYQIGAVDTKKLESEYDSFMHLGDEEFN